MSNYSDNQKIEGALQTFFNYLSRRKSLNDQMSANERCSFTVIIDYYKPRLASALNLDPHDRLHCHMSLYNHCWTQLWRCGQQIQEENRTPAGVYMWLKTVLYRSQLKIWKINAKESILIGFVDELMRQGNGTKRPVQRRTHLLCCQPELGMISDPKLRFQLLHDSYQAALSRLNKRQQQIIEYSNLAASIRNYDRLVNGIDSQQEGYLEFEKGYRLSVIKRIMGFSSIDAVKSFQQRAFRALVKELVRLFRESIDQPKGDLVQKEILEEWLERYGGCRQPNGRTVKD